MLFNVLTLSPRDCGVINCLSAELINFLPKKVSNDVAKRRRPWSARGSPFDDIRGERVKLCHFLSVASTMMSFAGFF